MNGLNVSQTAVLWRNIANNEHDLVVITGDHRAMVGRVNPFTGVFQATIEEDMMPAAVNPARHPVCSCGHSKYRHSPVDGHRYCTIDGCSCDQFQDNGGDLV